MKTVYISHPLRGDVNINIAKVGVICSQIANKREVVPISPIHAFGFMDVNGDQKQALDYCLTLLSKCDELWMFGKWSESEGCKLEMSYARDHNIPVKLMGAGAEVQITWE